MVRLKSPVICEFRPNRILPETPAADSESSTTALPRVTLSTPLKSILPPAPLSVRIFSVPPSFNTISAALTVNDNNGVTKPISLAMVTVPLAAITVKSRAPLTVPLKVMSSVKLKTVEAPVSKVILVAAAKIIFSIAVRLTPDRVVGPVIFMLRAIMLSLISIAVAAVKVRSPPALIGAPEATLILTTPVTERIPEVAKSSVKFTSTPSMILSPPILPRRRVMSPSVLSSASSVKVLSPVRFPKLMAILPAPVP